MQLKRYFVAAAVWMSAAGSVDAAIGNDGYVTRGYQETAAVDSIEPRANPEAAATREQLRETGGQVCEQVVDAATQIGATFQQIGMELLPLMMKTGEELARQMEPTVRELEPTMRQFAERLRDMARQMEQSLQEQPRR